MELHSENVVPLDCRGKRPAIAALRDRFRYHWRTVRMRVIDKGPRLDAVQQARTAICFNPVPAHMRRFHLRWKTITLTGEQRSARSPGRFGAAFKYPLHSHANPQKWSAAGNGFQHRLSQGFIQDLTTTKVPHTWNHYLCRSCNPLRVSNDFRMRAQVLQSFLYRTDVSRAVV